MEPFATENEGEKMEYRLKMHGNIGIFNTFKK